MNNYCTLFDTHYLSRGLAMYHSLVATGERFCLYVLCMDDATHQLLDLLNLPGIATISLAEFETSELLDVKKDRTTAEYCWTCTPHLIRYLLDSCGIPECTYLDADLFFYAAPGDILTAFRETGSSVLITPHRYTARYDQSTSSGIYCVQFVTFRADDPGREALSWWCERCTEWCYCRYEEGRFGDQKYLDDWPVRFEGVHVLQHPGAGLAAWNVQQFSLTSQDGRLEVNALPLIFYHFHHLRLYSDGMFDMGPYQLTSQVVQQLYHPYLKALREAEQYVNVVQPGFCRGYLPPLAWRDRLKLFLKGALHGEYNLQRVP